MKLKQEGLWECRKSRIEFVNVSPASLCILTESFCLRYILGEWWAVACEYRLIIRCIAGAMKLLARYIAFSRVRANNARMLLRSALPQGQVSIGHKGNHNIQIRMKTIIDGSRCWTDNTLYWASTERQPFVVLKVRQLNSDLVPVNHNRYIGSFYRQRRQQYGNRPILRISVNKE